MKLAPEGIPFVVALALATLAGWLFVHPWLGLAFLTLTLFTVWFFRDPERETPREPGLLISPADGKVLLTGPDRVSVFMNVFNVHVCRTPIGGEVLEVNHTPGDFRAAYRDDASERNERTEIRVGEEGQEIRFTLVAGLIARRIVCRVRPGERLEAGDRVGVIRFGSRVDVFLPEGADPAVVRGQSVLAGETVIARLRAREAPARQAAHVITRTGS